MRAGVDRAQAGRYGDVLPTVVLTPSHDVATRAAPTGARRGSAPGVGSPRGRGADVPERWFGVLWAAAALAAVFAGPGWAALVFAPTAGLAAVQASATWRRTHRRRPIDGAAGLGAVALVAAAALGLTALLVTGVVVFVLTIVLDRVIAARHRAGLVRSPRSLLRTLTVLAVTGAAGAAPVALRRLSAHGAVPALVLCTYALVYDASSSLMGTGPSRRSDGLLAGQLSIVAVTMAVASALVPPFGGWRPWILGLVALGTTPLGPLVGTAVLGQPGRRVPALRRLDSLIVLGPVWAAAALHVVG